MQSRPQGGGGWAKIGTQPEKECRGNAGTKKEREREEKKKKRGGGRGGGGGGGGCAKI